MSGLASPSQLRMSFVRWALVTVPLVLLLGMASGVLSGSGEANHWYAALIKPDFTPPGRVIGLIWSCLYTLMGIAVAMILHARGAPMRGLAIGLFSLQLVFNLLWSPIFFAAHQVAISVWWIGATFLLAAATTLVFARIRRPAAWCMVPYLLWLGFAGTLAHKIDVLNPDATTLAPGATTTQIPDGRL